LCALVNDSGRKPTSTSSWTGIDKLNDSFKFNDEESDAISISDYRTIAGLSILSKRAEEESSSSSSCGSTPSKARSKGSKPRMLKQRIPGPVKVRSGKFGSFQYKSESFEEVESTWSNGKGLLSKSNSSVSEEAKPEPIQNFQITEKDLKSSPDTKPIWEMASKSDENDDCSDDNEIAVAMVEMGYLSNEKKDNYEHSTKDSPSASRVTENIGTSRYPLPAKPLFSASQYQRASLLSQPSFAPLERPRQKSESSQDTMDRDIDLNKPDPRLQTSQEWIYVNTRRQTSSRYESHSPFTYTREVSPIQSTMKTTQIETSTNSSNRHDFHHRRPPTKRQSTIINSEVLHQPISTHCSNITDTSNADYPSNSVSSKNKMNFEDSNNENSLHMNNSPSSFQSIPAPKINAGMPSKPNTNSLVRNVANASSFNTRSPASTSRNKSNVIGDDFSPQSKQGPRKQGNNAVSGTRSSKSSPSVSKCPQQKNLIPEGVNVPKPFNRQSIQQKSEFDFSPNPFANVVTETIGRDSEQHSRK
jgi:hypothetical protein